MNIIHVCDSFLPRLGGIETQAADLVARQREAGHAVLVVTATPGEPMDGVRRITVRMPYELPVHPRGTRHLTRLFAANRPDVVHVHVGAVSPFSWQGVRAAARLGLPTVVTVHSMWDPATRGLYRALPIPAGVVGTAVSEAAAALIRRVVPNPIHVVPNGISLTEWASLATWTPEPVRDDGDVHVITVGRLAPRKRPLDLLRVLRAARARVSGSTFGVRLRATIIGDGPARPAMERYLRRHRMDWVTLAGRVPRAELKQLLASADIFLNPARLESFGLAALEARTAGIPVVAWADSGVADFVRHGREGLLADDLRGLASGVVRLARDGRLRQEISSYNRENPPMQCSWPFVLDAFDKCYGEAGGRGRGA